MRRKWVWDPEVNDLVEVSTDFRQMVPDSAMIMPDIPDFVSPIDQQVVHGRRGLREHNNRHQVTNAADYTNEWKAAAAERAKLFTGDPSYDRQARVGALVDAYDRNRRK